jgi:hypothetical protein
VTVVGDITQLGETVDRLPFFSVERIVAQGY